MKKQQKTIKLIVLKKDINLVILYVYEFAQTCPIAEFTILVRNIRLTKSGICLDVYLIPVFPSTYVLVIVTNTYRNWLNYWIITVTFLNEFTKKAIVITSNAKTIKLSLIASTLGVRLADITLNSDGLIHLYLLKRVHR